jgi:hypothetical protein
MRPHHLALFFVGRERRCSNFVAPQGVEFSRSRRVLRIYLPRLALTVSVASVGDVETGITYSRCLLNFAVTVTAMSQPHYC